MTKRYNNSILLVAGLAITLLGMFWLSQVSMTSNYWISIALPMILIGIGQGASLSPLTSAGISGTEARDSGAASGVVNVAHQLGGSLGLAILVAIAAKMENSSDVVITRTAQVEIALKVGSIMLFLALIVTLVLILPKEKNKWE
ncbi:hypothetical protein ACFP7A_09065 [Sporolactobacillus kofuensis]|uniref:Major facilitator superfamily (MFS) profile domain-containing protein n=1 Tax=Sporolactobacillus kofuensis TaxID=269672 RepID=A0ABW1WDU0_9BACL|nr:hypothetical protein [Sporolactobacillus kofuensis]MCO7176127.1 hypothetical protein [Sporolactobacillus kofuensis]